MRGFASVAKSKAAPTRPTTPWTAIAMTAVESPLQQQQVSPLSPRNPTKSLGATRVWSSCRPCSRSISRLRKLVSPRNISSATMTPVAAPTLNRKLGMVI